MDDLRSARRNLRARLGRRHPLPGPIDRGELLGVIERDDERQVRIVLGADFAGQPVLTLRVWAPAGGGWVPLDGAGLTVRAGDELRILATAVQAAADRIEKREGR